MQYMEFRMSKSETCGVELEADWQIKKGFVTEKNKIMSRIKKFVIDVENSEKLSILTNSAKL